MDALSHPKHRGIHLLNRPQRGRISVTPTEIVGGDGMGWDWMGWDGMWGGLRFYADSCAFDCVL
jgi:hypothetical protein